MGEVPRLHRYQLSRPIRRFPSFHLHAARHPGGGARVLVAGAPGVDPGAVRRCLSRLADAHEKIRAARVPAVAERGLDGPEPFVALACDAVTDLETASGWVGASGERLTLAQAAAFVFELREALALAHQAGECLGTLSATNILFSASGEFWLTGFGHNAATTRENGMPSGLQHFYAPEQGLGAPPSPERDLFALTSLTQGALAFVDFPPQLQQALLNPGPDHSELRELIAYPTVRLLGASVDARPGIEEANRAQRRLLELIEVEPDLAGYIEFNADIIERFYDEPHAVLPGNASKPRPRSVLRLGAGVSWMSVDGGAEVPLRFRQPLRRLLRALVEQALSGAPGGKSTEDLQKAGWPGEVTLPEAGVNRVHVAISTLRRLGLGALLERHAQGYRLSPRLKIEAEGPLDEEPAG